MNTIFNRMYNKKLAFTLLAYVLFAQPYVTSASETSQKPEKKEDKNDILYSGFGTLKLLIEDFPTTLERFPVNQATIEPHNSKQKPFSVGLDTSLARQCQYALSRGYTRVQFTRYNNGPVSFNFNPAVK